MLVELVKAGFLRLVLTITCLFLLGTAAQAQIRIVALGDSEIRGKGVAENDAYPAKLERALKAKGHNVVVTNAGVNGDTTKGVLSRMDSAVPQGTRIVILSVGGNDIILHGADRATTITNLLAIISRLRARNIEVLVFALPVGNKHGKSSGDERARMRALGAQPTDPMQFGLVDNPKLHVEEVWRTGTEWHLNAAGYDLVVQRTLPLVEELIRKP